MLLLCLSKRAKSIYYLRLFNESVLMLPLYLAILLFTYQQWFWGVLLLSLSLSIKMNILLFFPGLLLLLFEVSLFSSSHPSPSASFAPSSSSASSSSRSSHSACPSSPPTPPTTSAAPTNSSLRCQGITRRAACSPTSGPSTSSSSPTRYLPLPLLPQVFVSPQFGRALLCLQLGLLLLFIFTRWTQ